jgi:hypothetical protein
VSLLANYDTSHTLLTTGHDTCHFESQVDLLVHAALEEEGLIDSDDDDDEQSPDAGAELAARSDQLSAAAQVGEADADEEANFCFLSVMPLLKVFSVLMLSVLKWYKAVSTFWSLSQSCSQWSVNGLPVVRQSSVGLH